MFAGSGASSLLLLDPRRKLLSQGANSATPTTPKSTFLKTEIAYASVDAASWWLLNFRSARCAVALNIPYFALFCMYSDPIKQLSFV